ncbi:hypothetical protein DM860_006422 [Cuscuta australis]|uniref:BZIP domain-containing protein n=2 Tax=Cuscuta sect. Cleistogrammica TaxID=1824901 RepID=A0A328D3F7_9ASTE|nr:hypothetical protein DM860_006422 [Cuscuta australis]
MGSSERDKSPKEAKEPLTPSSQEHATTTSSVNPEWPGFQAYSPVPPHGFLASNPQAHPYVWGVQHLMPPYGTPPHPYVAVYPHGSIYAHPSIPPGSYPFSPFPMPSPNGISETSANTSGNVEVNSKASEGKEKLPIKRSKGGMRNYKMVSEENNEPGKTSAVTANGAYSKSAESASEGSTGGSDVNSQNGSQTKSRGEATQNGESNDHALAMAPQSTGGVTALGVAGPTTNLNIGMEDYWGSAPPVIHAIQGKVPSAPVATGSREGVQPQHWIQNEKELKRQRRKQSNRESARRSRLRKQAECDELAQRAEALKAENASLRAEISRMQSEYEQLTAQNASLKQRLGEVPGKDEPRPTREESPPAADRLSSEAATANGDQ